MIEELKFVVFTWVNSSTLYVAPTETDIAFYCTVSFGDSSLANWALRAVKWGTRIRINVTTS